MERTLVLADLHVGSLVAIWPEHGLLPEGGEWQLNKPQRYLLRQWARLQEELDIYKTFDNIVVNGDVIDGAKPRAMTGIVTGRLDYQASAAIDLLAPLRKMCDKFFMIRGTEFHGGDADQEVTQIARSLDATKNPATDEWTWPDILLDVGGDNIWHIAHHSGVSKRLAYEGTALLSAFTDYKLNLARAYGKRAPNLTGICRSHAHRLLAIEKPPWNMMAITGWKLKDDYAYRVAPSSLPELGYGLIEYDKAVHASVHSFPLPPMHVEGK
jgi:hypothetical protein